MPALDRRDPEYRERLEERRAQWLADYRDGRMGRWTLRLLLLSNGTSPRDVDAEIALNRPEIHRAG